MYAELTRAVDDLAQWLTVVKVGLSEMVDMATTDTIEEEHEGLSDFGDEQVTPGLRRHRSGITDVPVES